MVFSKSGLLIFLRVLLITGLLAASVFSFYETDLNITPVMFLLLSLVMMFELVWHVQRLQRNWAQFLLSVKHQDFTRRYSDPAFPRLNEAYDLITSSFENLRQEKQAEYRLLHTVTDHVKIGLVCFYQDGSVVFANKALKRMLRLEALADISSLEAVYPKTHQLMTNQHTVEGALIDEITDRRILVKTEDFQLQGQAYRIASLYDIRNTLETNELESYQKLMRVMTHEIMNSAAPILSLIRVINQKLIDGDTLKDLSPKDQKNTSVSLRVVETRTEGILSFVEAYRTINKDIQLDKKEVETAFLLAQVTPLLDGHDPPVESIDRAKGMVFLDSDLIMQVLLNLVKNAREAVVKQSDPKVILCLETNENELIMTVKDNGPGIPDKQVGEAFVPFFTTKKEGSGVGLALSRKIVQAHGGRLVYQRTEDSWTEFRVMVPLGP